ncbi:CU044_5270 family protein [Streptomyces sp. NPDC047981]|uniref:CU044_5270 family protein n=1 Tax=Streptomyces sp. NPDC047981 TaxID=3154610 RepID=UPI0034393977
MTIGPHRTGDHDHADPAGLLPPPAVPALTPEREQRLKAALLSRVSALDELDALDARTVTAAGRRPRPRLVRVLAPAVACALVIGGAVALGPSGTRPAVNVPAAASPEAARLLDRIALAAGEETRPALRADQFVYVESRVAYGSQSAGGGPVALAPAHTRQVWLSADGTRPGLLREEGGADSPLGADPAARTTVEALAGLPTDPDALLARIRQDVGAGSAAAPGADPDQSAFAAIGDLLMETWAPPRLGAALYRAAGRIPGVVVVPAATDAVGRPGVAVARTSGGRQTQWVFDPATHAFLGERTVLTESGEAGTKGTVVGTSAILTRTAVDRAGELPRR